MSTVSSNNLRPFGRPALSPPITPNRLTEPGAVGGTLRFSFSVSAAAGFDPICVTPGIPVNSAWTMSWRLLVGHPRPNSALIAFTSSGSSAYWPNRWPSPDGFVRLNSSLRETGMNSSLINGLPRRLTCTQGPMPPRPRPLVSSSLRRSVEAQTPTTGVEDAGPTLCFERFLLPLPLPFLRLLVLALSFLPLPDWTPFSSADSGSSSAKECTA